MRPPATCLGVALAVAAAGLLAPPGPVPRAVAQDLHGGEPLADAGALFREQCASCHVTPDPNVATDLAFIRQLQETA